MSWIVNERENDWSLTSLNALIVTDWDDTDWEGVPDIIPVDGLIDRPIGSDPETMEIVETLVRLGVIEKDSPWPMMRLVWGYEMRDEMISIEIETETDPPPFSALIE